MVGRATGAMWQGPAKCDVCVIRDLGLFSDLERETISQFEREIARIAFPAGAPLYFAGDPGDAVMTLRGGVVKLVFPSEAGHDRIVRLLRGGDVAGLEATTGEPYHHTAVALSDAQICRIPVHTLRHLSERAPQVNQRIMYQWQRLVTQADEWIAFLASGPARSRVARLLLYLAPASGPAPCLLPSREDMAAMLGVTVETASRIVADLRRQSVLEPLGGHEARIDRAALETLIQD